MPLNTETIVLTEEHSRLDDRLDALADTVADADDGTDVSDAVEEAQRIENRHLPGVQWGIDEFGTDTTVTIGALTTGERHSVSETVSRINKEKQQFGGAAFEDKGSPTSVFVAAGIVDAPFVETDENGEKQNDILSLLATVDDELQPQFTGWLEHRINELSSHTPGNSTPFAERVAAKRQETEQQE